MTIPHVEEKKAYFLRSGLQVNSLAKLVSFPKNKIIETLENIGLSQGNFNDAILKLFMQKLMVLDEKKLLNFKKVI